MVAHDKNHVYAKPAGAPNFFTVVDLIERGMAERGVAASAHFHEDGAMGRRWMHFDVLPGTRDEIHLTVRALPLGPQDEIQNLRCDMVSGPGSEQALDAMREILARFGGHWEERNYYTADKVELPQVRKSPAPAYVPSARIRAAVKIAGSIGFGGMEPLLDLLGDRAKSAAYARTIMDYGLVRFGMHDVGPDPRAFHAEGEEADAPAPR